MCTNDFTGPFFSGVFATLLVGGILGFFVFRLSQWQRKIDAFFKPQAIVHFTGKTPWQVFKETLRSFVLTVLVLSSLVLLALYLLSSRDVI